jgi:hypothetical protein
MYTPQNLHYNKINNMPTPPDKLTDDESGKMSKYILEGLSEEEAALLCGISRQRLSQLKQTNENYNDFINTRKIEFKHQHLKIITSRSDPKTSQWILERLRPQEFAPRAKSPDDSSLNSIAAIINAVQEKSGTPAVTPRKHVENSNDSSTQGPERSTPRTIDDLLS